MKKIFYLFIFLLPFGLTECSNHHINANQSEKQKDIKVIKQCFEIWKKQQIHNHIAWANDSCFMGWYTAHHYNDSSVEWGFPRDSSDYNYSYADVNNDGIMDGLVTFNPEQCDGGNALMWDQYQVFVVSENGKYRIIDSLSDGMFSFINPATSSGFYWYDSIGTNKVYATYYQFKEGDGHCCPGIAKPVILDYKTRRIIFTGKNKPRNN